jgi:hypothetical protein
MAERDPAARKDPTAAPPPDAKGDAAPIADQQHTGNHNKPGSERGGADRFGGTRAGAENVEPAKPKKGGP